MHVNASPVSRQERVRQVMTKESSISDYENYVPISRAVEKTKSWAGAGAEVFYLTSRTGDQVDKILNVLKRYDFPSPENLTYRVDDEEYSDVVKRIQPHILIEDNCESIGGKTEMISPTLSDSIQTIVIKEFEGIDILPEEPQMLLS